MIEGEILSISDVIQCKISFEINGDDINYRIYSPIFESWREINGSFVNGMLDGRIKNIIIDKICDFVDVHDDVSRAAMLFSVVWSCGVSFIG